jgi:hypothetical protein
VVVAVCGGLTTLLCLGSMTRLKGMTSVSSPPVLAFVPAVPYGWTHYIMVEDEGRGGLMYDGRQWEVASAIRDHAIAREYAVLLANSGRTVMLVATRVEMFFETIAPEGRRPQ